MKPAPWTHLDRYRVVRGAQRSPLGADYGAFVLRNNLGQSIVVIAASAHDGTGWEHVSVSLRNRCPNWPEMAMVKSLFWDDEETVIQFHPPRSVYVNNDPFVLHLWKPAGIVIPTPPTWMIGLRDGQTEADMNAEVRQALGS